MKLKAVELFLALGLAAGATACGGGAPSGDSTPSAEPPATEEAAPATTEPSPEATATPEATDAATPAADVTTPDATSTEGGEGGEGGEGEATPEATATP